MSRNECEIIEKFLVHCETEFQREAEQLQAAADLDPTEHKKKAALGARWAMYHTKEIKKRLPRLALASGGA